MYVKYCFMLINHSVSSLLFNLYLHVQCFSQSILPLFFFFSKSFLTQNQKIRSDCKIFLWLPFYNRFLLCFFLPYLMICYLRKYGLISPYAPIQFCHSFFPITFYIRDNQLILTAFVCPIKTFSGNLHE